MFLKEFSSYIDNDTIIYNSDKIGKLPLVIYGLSGSGKTVLSKEIQNINSKYKLYEIDEIGLEIMKTNPDLTAVDILEKIKLEFITKPTQYKILEGLQIAWWTDNDEYRYMREILQTYPTIVLGTSHIKSNYRAFIRNWNTKGADAFAFMEYNDLLFDENKKYLKELQKKNTSQEIYNIEYFKKSLKENHSKITYL
jgi:hypothetical protein